MMLHIMKFKMLMMIRSNCRHSIETFSLMTKQNKTILFVCVCVYFDENLFFFFFFFFVRMTRECKQSSGLVQTKTFVVFHLTFVIHSQSTSLFLSTEQVLDVRACVCISFFSFLDSISYLHIYLYIQNKTNRSQNMICVSQIVT